MLEIPERSLLGQQAKSNDIRFLLSVATVTIGMAVLVWLIVAYYQSGSSHDVGLITTAFP